MRAALLLLCLPLVSCDDHLLSHSRRSGVDCDREPPLTWDTFGAGRMRDLCAGCHSSLYAGERRKGAPEGVDLDTLDGVVDWVDEVLVRTVDREDMPPGGGLTDDELAELEEWLVCDVAVRAIGAR